MKDKKTEETSNKPVPRHVAIIMDGNGRWAKKRLLPRNAGHVQGSRVAEQICEDAFNLGIEYLTIYAFSTENWARPKDEVDALMKLLRKYMKDSIQRSSKNNMRVHVIGDISALDESKNNYLMCVVCMADSYGISVCDITTGEFLVTEVFSEEALSDE
ncbi:MAG: di-trans,poly-cis-decaprenylcistransferase, partial [Lachnospiraceae bacterium]|nr:di-trans,poly-cis-decaprenylcistransferase [Lachnospiraceae bacterium]